MRKLVISILFMLLWGSQSHAQANFWVSCPSEIKMNGLQSYFFVSHHTYLIYNSNSSTLQLIVNMSELHEEGITPRPGEQISYTTNLEDSNSLIFTGFIPENKIRPQHDLKDTYTFSVEGTVKYRDVTYTTMAICSYGERMLRNNSQTAINLNLELLKMDTPMYMPSIKAFIDNLKIEVEDGTVNMVQN